MDKNTKCFLEDWFERCPQGQFLEIRAKKRYVTSDFFDNLDAAILYLEKLKDVQGQHVWFGAQPRSKLTENERLDAFRVKWISELKKKGLGVKEGTPEFRKTLLEEYGEIGGSDAYVKSVICHKLDYDCNEKDDVAGVTEENYGKIQEWTEKLHTFIEDEDVSGTMINSGNGVQLFLWLKKAQDITKESMRAKFQEKTEEMGEFILETCPHPLMEYDSTTSEHARVMRLVGFSNPKGGRKATLLHRYVQKKPKPFNTKKVKGSLNTLLNQKVGGSGRYRHFIAILGYLANRGVSLVDARATLEKVNKENISDPAPEGYIANALSNYEMWCFKAVEEKEEDGGKKKKLQPEDIADLVMEQYDTELFVDQFDTPHARFWVNEHFEIHKIESGTFATFVSWIVWEEHEKGVGGEILNTVIRILKGKAIHEGEEHELHLRLAFHEGAIWYDLCDDKWRVVKIDKEGWEIVDNPPLLFSRRSHMKAQVEPIDGGGEPANLLKFQNLKTDEDKHLSLIYTCTAFVPHIQHVIPILYGAQGSAKSTFFELNRALVDPSSVPLLELPRDKNEMTQQLYHHYCPYYDNISELTEWQSNTLCRAVTGQGFSKRQLYTDDDDVIYHFKRACGLNGINVAGTKADLLDRSLLIELERIPRYLRKSNIEFWEGFDGVKGELLGAFFSVLSLALSEKDKVKLRELPRMADFAIWGEAFSRVLGYKEDGFIRNYVANTQIQNMEAIMGTTFGELLMEIISEEIENKDGESELKGFEGTPSELYKRLVFKAEENNINIKKDKNFPQNPTWTTRKLNELRSNLMEEGWEIRIVREERKRTVFIESFEKAKTRKQTLKSY